MEIISYINQSSADALTRRDYSSLSLDDMLSRQRRAKKIADSRIDFSEIGASIKFITRQLAFSLKKLRWVIFTIFMAGLLACLSMGIVFSLKSVPRAATFENAVEIEAGLVAGAMKNFVLNEEEVDYLDDGTLFIPENMSFTQPVTYSDYTVKSGESISTISKRYNLSNISTLISVNDISNARTLRAGQKIIIPSIDGIIHTVKSGDSLDSIANKYDVSVETLLDVNDISSDILQSGERIFIPGVALDSSTLRKALGELFIKPLKCSYRLTSPYGYRADPFTGVRSFHTGIDMAVSKGTPIVASMGGKVTAAGWNNVYGNYVIINHGNGYQTLYAHMQKYVVQLNQEVSQGQKIGLVGSTGYSTGPHLHFSVYKNGKLIDPLTVLK